MGPAHPPAVSRAAGLAGLLVLVMPSVVLAGVIPACAQVLGVDAITVQDSEGGGAASVPPTDRECQEPADCPIAADNPSQCAERACVDGRCAYRTHDDDGDGFRSSAACTIDLPGVTVTPGEDCDDADPGLSPVMKRACGTAPGAPSPFPNGRPLGECREGQQACVQGQIGPCTGVVGPSAETCEGAKDENCDGAVDEGCPCNADAPRPCGVAVGSCTQGTQSCTAGKWSACSGGAGPKPRDCTSAADNDCDGKSDSTQCACTVGTEQACATTKPGSCSTGKRTCTASADKTSAAYAACVQTVFPGALACDGADHDCNGTADTAQDAPVAPADVGNACIHVYFCPAADRREICYRNGVGYTYECDGDRRRLGYAKKASSAGSPNPAPPAGYVRIGVNSVGTKVGPYRIANACCGANGCFRSGDQYDGVFVSTGELGTQLYTRVP